MGETDVRIDTSAQGQSWDNEVINKQQFEDGLRQVMPELTDEELDALPIAAGWLRLKALPCFLLIALGKGLRYAVVACAVLPLAA